MKRKNATRKALLLSVMALLLCCTMLVGTTFAWFTDSVTSGNNIIAAGNLDVELEYSKDAQTWASVSGKTDLFSTQKWEPGHTEVVYFRMKNAGTLNLNYQLGININGETAGKNVAGDSFNLSDYILFGVKDGQSAVFADRAAAVAAVSGSAKKLNAGYTEADSMAPGAVSNFALVVYMPETVGNEANYREIAPSINLGVTLVATQEPVENDSFGNDYDANVPVPTAVATAAELKDVLTTGGSAVLTEDIQLAEPIVVSRGSNASLDLNGHEITATSDRTATNNFMFDVNGGSLTVANGTINFNHTGANMGWGGAATIFDVTNGGVLNIENATVVNKGGTDMNFAVHLNNWGEATLNVRNSTLSATYMAVRVFNSGPNMNNVTIENSTLTGKYCLWVHNYGSSDLGGKVYSGAQQAYNEADVKARLNLDIYGNGNTFNCNNDYSAPIRYGFNESLLFDANGNRMN